MKRMLFTVLGLTLFTAACSDPVPPAAPTPVTPTITETFTDTLGLLGYEYSSVFSAAGWRLDDHHLRHQPGCDGDASALATQSLVGCTVLQQLTRAPGGADARLVRDASPHRAHFCVQVFDSNSIPEPVTYTLTVLHS